MTLIRNPRFLGLVVVALVVPAAFLMGSDPVASDTAIVATVKKGDFVASVSTSGELSALESIEISAPANARQVQIYQMKIASIVPEGTMVEEGDLVADLDRSELASKQAEFTLALQKATAVYEQAMLDSTLTLSQAREEIRGMELAVEEADLAVQQSVYEPPTIQRQAEIEKEKATRALAQAKLDYVTKVEQAQAKMREVGADVEREQNRLDIIADVMGGFTVRAPAAGMVIYKKEWDGRKRKTGSQVNSWDPSVATLPNLSKMESITYVNEIDIRRVSVGQAVAISLDSDPSKKLAGRVMSVANVGEQRPNTDAKVFEVHIAVDIVDTTLRPGMTTGNSIETLRETNVLSIPIESLGSENGVPFVYQQTGGSVRKQEVATGSMNENEVVVLAGLEEGDRVLLTPPANRDDLTINRLSNPPSHPDPATVRDSSDRTIPLPIDSTSTPRD